MENKRDMLNSEKAGLSNGLGYSRLKEFFDEGIFTEINAFVKCGKGYAEVVAGFGKANGCDVLAFAQNDGKNKGAFSKAHADKIKKVFDMAVKVGLPVVGFYDSIGARVDEGFDMLSAYGEILNKMSNISGVVPMISVILGPCLGTSSILAESADFVIMSKKGTLAMEVDGSSSGTAEDAMKQGICHIIANDDKKAIEKAKDLISILPMNNLSPAEMGEIEISDFSEKDIIGSVFDKGSFIEIQKEYGKEITVGFSALNGETVGVVKTNGGIIDYEASEKASRFIRFCDAFSLPVITFADSDGFKSVKSAAKLSGVYAEATTIKLTVITGKAYGSFYVAVAGDGANSDVTMAWVDSSICALVPKTAVAVMWTDKLNKTTLSNRDKLIEEFKTQEATAYNAAVKGYVQDVINPEDTREKLISAMSLMAGKRVTGLSKKHNNFI